MKEILDKLFDELEWCERNDDFFDYSSALGFAWNNNLEFNSGAFKFVFTKPEWNYVIKMPRTEVIERKDFIDYIGLEIKNYEIAKSMEIEKILMPNTCIGWINFHGETVKIYQQPKYTRSWWLFDDELADVLKKRMHYNWNEIHKIVQNFFDYGMGIEDAWVGRIVQLYGMNFLRKVAEWTNKCAINDLHTANYGVVGRRPVIIDYSGFFEENIMTIGEYFGKNFPDFYKECRYSLQREGVEITSFSLKDYQTRPITKAIIDYYKNTPIKRYTFQVGGGKEVGLSTLLLLYKVGQNPTLFFVQFDY